MSWKKGLSVLVRTKVVFIPASVYTAYVEVTSKTTGTFLSRMALGSAYEDQHPTLMAVVHSMLGAYECGVGEVDQDTW